MKVCIGLSGGVDSSVAALLLKQQGYDVVAMFMQNWHDADATLHGDCEWEEDRFVAEMVARKIGIPFYFIDLSKEYRAKVVDYMFDEYAKGRTPNPDVLCNREIKFGAFLEAARKLGADMVATGHYCRKVPVQDAGGQQLTDDEDKPLWSILEGADPNKDQSYFLCGLTQEQLSLAMFPIGGLPKPEVRRLAKEAGLQSADKKDSQGICFVGKVDLPVFLQQKLQPHEGDIVEVFDTYYIDNEHYQWTRRVLGELLVDGMSEVPMISRYVPEEKILTKDGNPLGDPVYDLRKLSETADKVLYGLSEPVKYDIRFETETYRSGKHHEKKTRWKANPYGAIIGRHDGAQFYTIGQRKGLNVGGHKDSIFVISTDMEKNLIYVGEGQLHKGLSRNCLRINPSEVHWIRPDREMKPGDIRRYRVRARYRQPLQSATLICRENGLFILFDEAQRGLTAGQFAVWYDGTEMLGSGPVAE